MELRYETWGEGELPLVLLHGFTGNAHSWDSLRPLWSKHVRAFALNLPGHGGSPLPQQTGPEGFEDTLIAIERLLDSLSLSTVHLLGYSQGGRLALAFALRAPHRVHRLILESAHAGLEDGQARQEREKQERQWASLIETEGVEAFCDYWEALPLFSGVRRLSAERQAQLSWLRRSATAEGLIGALGCLGLSVQPDCWPMLNTLRVPTLLLTGAEDSRFTALARRMEGELPTARHHVFQGVGHAPHVEAEEAYARTVLSFLTEAGRKPHWESECVA